MEPSTSTLAPLGVHGDPKAARPGDPETLTSLRRFARPRPAVERCDLCGAELTPYHPHLLDKNSRQIACSCDACAILFCGQQTAKFIRIPRRVLLLDGFSFTDAQWDAMMLPINLAFLLRRLDGSTAAMYPSPAGVMESLIKLPPWDALFTAGTHLSSVEPEVEALLINRIGDRAAHFIVPIDGCYRLVGLIRTKWRGLSGGAEAGKSIADFFADLEHRATRVAEANHA